MLSTSIRSYRTSDLEACRDLWRELTQRHRDIYGDPTIGGDDPGPAFDRHLTQPSLVGVWVAEDDTGVVGFCSLLVDGEVGEIDPVVVGSVGRSQGTGRQLLDLMVEEAKRRGVQFLSVRPVARNVEAFSFYHDAGFRTLGQIEMFMELWEGTGRDWKPGINIHGHDFRY